VLGTSRDGNGNLTAPGKEAGEVGEEGEAEANRERAAAAGAEGAPPSVSAPQRDSVADAQRDSMAEMWQQPPSVAAALAASLPEGAVVKGVYTSGKSHKYWIQVGRQASMQPLQGRMASWIAQWSL